MRDFITSVLRILWIIVAVVMINDQLYRYEGFEQDVLLWLFYIFITIVSISIDTDLLERRSV